MFPTFIGILDIQSWWEVPSIAHFCSLFRAAFNLLDFDIEDLEEALLTDGGTEGRLLQELIVRLLEGCLPNDSRNDISTFNYQMFLRRLFRKKCQEYRCKNPFNTDVDFELLPLRQKVEILRALCDFRLDAEDVEQSLSNLDSDSLRVEPLGHDRKNSAYWYFYGTRLYREDYVDCSNNSAHKQKSKPRDKKRKRRRNRVAKEEEEEEEEKEENSFIYQENQERESVWQVVCFTQQDWSRLVEKFRDSEYATERKLYRTLSEDFMPEIPKLFDLKEKQQRRKLLQRNNSRVLRSHELPTPPEAVMVKSKIKNKPNKGSKKGNQSAKSTFSKEESPPHLTIPPLPKKGRQTNNSLASAVGQIVIHTRDEVENLNKKKGVSSHTDGHYVSSNYGYKYGYSFGIEEEERRVGMHKVLESLKDHVDAWPFVDPVDEEYAPRYYSVVRKPMDLSTMEEKLEGGSYKSISEFKRDFRLIVDNCKQYNGSDNEYTEMAINLKEAFDKAVNRYLESETSSDEEALSKTTTDTPGSLSCLSRVASPLQNTRKRSKKSVKKSKSCKADNKNKTKSTDKVENEEKNQKIAKVVKKKKNKKKSKKVKVEDSVEEGEEEEEEEEEEEGQGEEVEEVEEEEELESEDTVSEDSIKTAKTRKAADVNTVLLKTKKLPSKESDETKKNNKKTGKEHNQHKKDIDGVKPIKESKENKKRKEVFEEDYESPVIAKSKSRKIEKKELEETQILTDNVKKGKPKKVERRVEEDQSEKEDTHHIRLKKCRKKEKVEANTSISEEKADKSRTKHKEKKSKAKEKLKNGDLSNKRNSKEVDTDSESHSLSTNTPKKMAAFAGNKDLESLDSLKDKISERRREEKLKHEKEKQKKLAKSELPSLYSKKVPSNGSTFHDGDKISVKTSKLKKGAREEKTPASENTVKNVAQDTIEGKKVKLSQAKHTKSFAKEESSAIQALNQATEQTLHDINKWLDDAPKLSEFSSGGDSPVFQPSTESNRPSPKTEVPRKRPSSIKIFGPHGPTRPKKIQRTIDRLQPGKSKGNLLLKKPLNLPNSTNESTVHQYNSDNDQGNKEVDEEPKLSLGTVLKNVDSIQLICKSLVSSPNPNFSNDDDEDEHISASATNPPHVKEEKSSTKVVSEASTASNESKEGRIVGEESQKPKTATPNLSAWFKAFGAPKSKKKDEECEEVTPKKESELQETVGGRQRKLSTGGSSVSESVSSFSQESPPGRSGRSPQGQSIVLPSEPQIRGAGFYQDALSTGSSPYNSPYYATPPRYSAQLPPTPSPQNHPLSPAYPSSASYEQPTAYPQLPQTHQTFHKPSPQESSTEVYHQMSPTFSQRSPQASFPQNQVPGEPYNHQLPSTNQSQSPVYVQQSPQPVPSVYPQTSPQAPPPNYSQPSPQQPAPPAYSQVSPQQNTPTNYSHPSPQPSTPNYSQPSPQEQHPPYSKPSPQQQHSPYPQSSPQQSSGYSQLSPQPPLNYSQSSPQPPSNYSQPSPQPPSNYSQPSPQPPSNYSQPSPQPPSNYSQPSPQPPSNYSQPSPQPPSNYSQPSPQPPPVYPQQSPQPANFSQPSPQAPPASYSQPSPQPLSAYSQPSPQPRNYSQPSPQQIQTFSQHSPQAPPAYSHQSPQNSSYSQPSPQQLTNYSQPSPQRSANYSHPMQSPQTPPNYSQLSPRQTTTNYSQPSASPQQSRNYSQPSPQQKASCTPQNYSQPSPQQITNYTQPATPKNTEDCPPSVATASNFPQGFKQSQSFIQSPVPVSTNEGDHRAEYIKVNNSEKATSTEQQRSFAISSESSSNLNTNHQIYQSSSQYPQAYGNSFTNIDLQKTVARHTSQEQTQQSTPQERGNFTDISECGNPQKYSQPRSFLGKSSAGEEPLQTQDQSQILAFQPNLTAHESLYQAGFQASGYTMPNTRPMFSNAHYFDANSKVTSSGTVSASSSSLPPVKKRIYNEPSSDSSRNLTQEAPPTRVVQEQFAFDPMMALPQPDGVSTSQFDNSFVSSLADSVATSPAYARLGLGLVSRTSKEQQQLLTIPRPPGKPEHLTYSRNPVSNTTELDLNLLQSLQTAASKNTQSVLSMSRRINDVHTSSTSTTTTTKTKKTRKSKQQQQIQQNTVTSSPLVGTEQQGNTGIPGFPQYTGTSADSISLKNASVVPPPAGSAFNFAAPASTAPSSPFYDKDPSAAAAAFAFLDEFRNPNSYYSMALRQQQQQQQQQQITPVTDGAGQSGCNKLNNPPPPRNYAPHPFLHSAQRSAAAAAAYGPPVSAYVTPHAPNLAVDPAAYQQYIHSFYALQPPAHHHRPSWL